MQKNNMIIFAAPEILPTVETTFRESGIDFEREQLFTLSAGAAAVEVITVVSSPALAAAIYKLMNLFRCKVKVTTKHDPKTGRIESQEIEAEGLGVGAIERILRGAREVRIEALDKELVKRN